MTRMKPPWIGERLVRIIVSKDDCTEKLGDFEEGFQMKRDEDGLTKAKLWYFVQLFRFIPLQIRNTIFWSFIMLNNYLKMGLRNLAKRKAYSFINITGLTVGITCCLLIMLWVQDELSINKFHENGDDLYMVASRILYSGTWYDTGGTVPALAPALKKEYPEVVNSARTQNGQNKVTVKYEKKVYIEEIQFGDVELLEMFSFPLSKGSLLTGLSERNSVYISEKIAEKYFSSNDPIGKNMSIDGKLELKVAGVFENIPNNSTIKFDIFAPLVLLEKFYGDDDYTQTWGNMSFRSYVQTASGVDISLFNEKIKDRVKIGNNGSEESIPYLTKYDQVYLYGYTGDGRAIGQVRFLSLIALFILMIACINFINLSTARAGNRAKEVGLRKVVGARRGDLIKQFYGESILLSFIALTFATFLATVFLPQFNTITGKALYFDLVSSTDIWIMLVAIVVVTSLVSGSYPALFLSSFQPVKVLNGIVSSGAKGAIVRKGLVIAQFSLSIGLIICTVVVLNQIRYLQDKNLGFDKELLLHLTLKGGMVKNYDAMKREMLQNPDVIYITATQHAPTGIYENGHNWNWEGREEGTDPLVTTLLTDYDFANAFDIEMESGRFLNPETNPLQKSTNIVINEAFADIMGFESAVGKSLFQGDVPVGEERTDFRIIGVVKNFHFKPLAANVGPLIIHYYTLRSRHMFLKLQSDNLADTISEIEKSYSKFDSEFPFNYSFLDDELNELYRSEEQTGVIIRLFAMVSILLSCLGLFGLASFMAEQKTKEIGIRKTLGASVFSICARLSSEYVKAILIANLFAWPFAFFLMRNWLEGYAYRIELSPLLFLLSGFIALTIALLTVLYQTLKAARANPIKALQHE